MIPYKNGRGKKKKTWQSKNTKRSNKQCCARQQCLFQYEIRQTTKSSYYSSNRGQSANYKSYLFVAMQSCWTNFHVSCESRTKSTLWLCHYWPSYCQQKFFLLSILNSHGSTLWHDHTFTTTNEHGNTQSQYRLSLTPNNHWHPLYHW